MIDPAYDMPLRNWQQQGSFIVPVAPPIDGPADGTLIQLPCVNQEWVLLLMGCVDQLRNPSTWLASLTDTARDLVLSRVTQLQEMLWSGMDVPCCNVEARLTSDCGLQLSTDGGSTWADVPGWSTYFAACVKAAIPPAVPTPVNPGVPSDNACAVAAWLAINILQEALKYVSNARAAGQGVDKVIQGIVNDIVAFAPVLSVIVEPFQAMYNYTLPQPLADLEAAANDSAFANQVKCAIYGAISSTGYVTALNFSAVVSAIGAISYTHTWVCTMLANFVNAMGLSAIQQLQAEGSLQGADCSDCAGNWCHEIDLTVSDGGAAPEVSGTGVWVSGEGWQSQHWSPNNSEYLALVFPAFPMAGVVSTVEVQVICGTYGSLGGHARCWFYYLGGVFQGYLDAATLAAFDAPTWVNIPTIAPANMDRIGVQWESVNGQPVVLTRVRLRGTGTSPFGPDNCTG